MEEEDKKYFLKAKKSLGQHFLRSEKALNDMVDSVTKDGLVFEIGPGEGVLTEKLLDKGHTVVVVEIDKRSIELLNDKFKSQIDNRKLYIIEKDCLLVDYGKEMKVRGFTHYILLGNIPYYITGAIFRQAFEQETLPLEMIFLIQKEVAQRIAAHDKKESLLSVSIKIFSDQVKVVSIVKNGSFMPPPKVDSAIIKIGNIVNPFKDTQHYETFFKILKASFSHKRKILISNLKTDLDKELQNIHTSRIVQIITDSNGEKARAEDVSINTWKQIINHI